MWMRLLDIRVHKSHGNIHFILTYARFVQQKLRNIYIYMKLWMKFTFFFSCLFKLPAIATMRFIVFEILAMQLARGYCFRGPTSHDQPGTQLLTMPLPKYYKLQEGSSRKPSGYSKPIHLWRLIKSSRVISFWPSFWWTKITSLLFIYNYLYYLFHGINLYLYPNQSPKSQFLRTLPKAPNPQPSHPD